MIDKVAYNDKIALQLVPRSMLVSVKAYYAKYGKDVEFLKSFALLCGTISRSTELQSDMYQMRFFEDIIAGLKANEKEPKLAVNSFYALSGLAYNNRENSNAIMAAGIIPLTKNFLRSQKSDATLVETVCSLYSNITYKNDKNKITLGEEGVMTLLIEIFKHYSTANVLKVKTVKQILRAIGNSCLHFKNTTQIVQAGFIDTSYKLAEKVKYKEEGEILRYTLDVISNLGSHNITIN